MTDQGLIKILFDDQIFTIQHYGGISLYFCRLMEQFSRTPEMEFRIALRYSLNEHLTREAQLNRFWTRRNNLFSDSAFCAGIQKKIRINVFNNIFQNRNESIRNLKTQEFDIFHPTYYDPYFLKHLKKRPFVLTIHDMIHERFPHFFNKNDPAGVWKRTLSARSERIIAVSENTRKDIIQLLGVPEDKVQVIHHGPSLPYHVGTGVIHGNLCGDVPDQYVLFVGNRFTYKNFTFMVEALAPVFASHSGLHLICAGGGNFSPLEKDLFRRIGISSRVRLFPADDATLSFLYRHARAFIFPSLYEGFGLPVIDAFNGECPAILSGTSSLPEVGGDAALYFNPTDRDSLAAVVREILADDNLRKSLVLKGRDRARLFSWEKTAKMTIEVYREAMEQGTSGAP